MKKGVPVSPGVAVARAYCVDEVLARREPYHLDAAALSGEVSRFDDACAAAARELDAIIARVARQVGEDEAAIFRAHRLLLRDPALLAKVKSAILDTPDRRRHRPAARCSTSTPPCSARSPTTYLQERMADLRDVVGRILAQLAAQEQPARRRRRRAGHPRRPGDPAVAGADVRPPARSPASSPRRGGATGHAAILARSLGIPAVSGLRGILREVHTGDLIALDGREGHVYLNPGPEVEAAYRKLQREYVDLRDQLIENRDLEPVTADGIARRTAGQRQRRRRRRHGRPAPAPPASACTAPSTCS